MADKEPLCELMRLMGPRERLAIIGTLLEVPGSTSTEIAAMLGTAPYEIDPHLTELHEGGVIVCDGEAWSLSPRVKAECDEEFLHFEARTTDGSLLRFRCNLEE